MTGLSKERFKSGLVIQKWKANVRRLPERAAVIYRDQKLTWKELWERSNRLANAYLMLGLKKGDRAQILLPNCLEYPEVFMAGIKAGLINSSGNYRLTGREIAYQLNDCGARVLIIKSFTQYESILSFRKQLPQLEFVILIDAETSISGAVPYRAVLKHASSRDPIVDISPEDIGLLMYTSGTTGFPKGVMCSHGALNFGPQAVIRELALSPEDIYIAPTPMYAAATLGCLNAALFSGGAIAIMPDFDPATILGSIEKYRATWTFMVPIMYEWTMSQSNTKADIDFPSLRNVVVCGAPLHNKTAEKLKKFFHKADVSNWLGSSELGFMTKFSYRKGLKAEGCVGRPIWGIELKIIDAEGKTVKIGVPGVLWAKGKTVFKAYFGREELNHESYIDDGWRTVGDIARQDEEGDFFVIDRKSDMIISGGINVYPAEIEQIIQKIDGVEDNAVIGVPDEKWGESVKALVVKKAGSVINAEKIIEECKKGLAGFKIPKSVDFVDRIPRSAIGKALKKELRDKYWSSQTCII